MELPILELDDVNTGYGRFKLNNINFKLNKGDILGLMGRSGSGKSTLMQTIVGLKRQNSGRILINGKQNLRALSSIGYSPQKNALYPHLSVMENILTFGRLHGMKDSDIVERATNLLGRLNLTSSSDKRISHLSGGMEKRADLVVTLIHNPDIIILDEPFNGLDISLQKFIWEFLKETAKEGKAVVLSSHILHDIQKNCNQVGLIDNGKYYSTSQLKRYIESKPGSSLEQFLEEVFSYKYAGPNPSGGGN